MDPLLMLCVGGYGKSFIECMTPQLRDSPLECFGIELEATSRAEQSGLSLRLYKPGVANFRSGKPFSLDGLIEGLLPSIYKLILVADAGSQKDFFMTQSLLSMANVKVPDTRVILTTPIRSEEYGNCLIADCLVECARKLANEVVLVDGCFVDYPEDSPVVWPDEVHRQVYSRCRLLAPGVLPAI